MRRESDPTGAEGVCVCESSSNYANREQRVSRKHTRPEQKASLTMQMVFFQPSTVRSKRLKLDAVVRPFSTGCSAFKKGEIQGKFQTQGAPCIQTYISGLRLKFDAVVRPFSTHCYCFMGAAPPLLASNNFVRCFCTISSSA